MTDQEVIEQACADLEAQARLNDLDEEPKLAEYDRNQVAAMRRMLAEVARLRSILDDVEATAAAATQSVVPRESWPVFFQDIRKMAASGCNDWHTNTWTKLHEAEAERDRLIAEVRAEADRYDLHLVSLVDANPFTYAARLRAIADRAGKVAP